MDSQAVVEAWMNSPTHKENILSKNYQEIGLAVVNGTLNGSETTLVVQLFGAPLAPAPVAQKTETVKEAPLPTPIASPMPTVQPVASEIEEIKPPEKEEAPLLRIALAQAKEETKNPPLLSPFMLTKTIAIFLLGLILGALVLDIALVYQKKIVRLSGRSIGHLIFIGGLLLTVILTTPGAIL